MNNVKKMRAVRGISQVELARKVRMAEANLCAIENERLKPWPRVIKKLCRALKTTSDELFPEESMTHHRSDRDENG